MKKMLLTAILAMAVLAASCGGTDGSELVEKYSDTEGVVQTVAVETPWLSAETEYSPDSDDSYDGIFSMKQSSALVTEDRIYFSKKIYHDDSDNHDKSYVYVSRKTGECASLCPDPLCAHTEGSGCRYLDLMQLIPDSGNSSVLYAMKQEFTEAGMKCSICRVDTENDTITELYADGSTFLTLKFISGGRLYFTTVLYERTKNPNGTISKNVVESFRALSLTDGGVDVIENGYSDRSHGEPFWSDGERVYFIEGSSRLFCTDMSFENERTLFEVSGEYQIISLYFDAETSEIWLCARTLFMNGLSDDGLIDGGIYRVDLDGEARRVAVPSDRVMDFVLTRKNIYYTS